MPNITTNHAITYINNTEALVISKILKFPLDGRTDTNFIAPLIINAFLKI